MGWNYSLLRFDQSWKIVQNISDDCSIEKLVFSFLPYACRMEYTNSYTRGCCLFEDVCDMSFSKDGKVICLTSADGNIDGELLSQNGVHHRYVYILVRKCGDDWPILMQLTPDEYNHKPVLATMFTPNVYDNSVPEGRIIFARQGLINIQNNGQDHFPYSFSRIVWLILYESYLTASFHDSHF